MSFNVSLFILFVEYNYVLVPTHTHTCRKKTGKVKEKREKLKKRTIVALSPERSSSHIPAIDRKSHVMLAKRKATKLPGVPWRKPETVGHRITAGAWASLSISADTIEPAALSTIQHR